MKHFVLIVGLMLAVGISSASPVFVTQSDPLSIYVSNPEGTCWYFPTAEKLDTEKLYDMPVTKDGNDYYCALPSSVTKKMSIDKYTLVYTYPSVLVNPGDVVYRNTIKNPVNYIKEYSWNPETETIVSILGNVSYESGKQQFMILSDLRKLVSGSRIDKSEEYQFQIQEPSLTITRLEQVKDSVVRVSGHSNFANGTDITIKVDESDRGAVAGWNATYKSKVVRPFEFANGDWNCDMIMPIQAMAPGWHTVAAYAGELQTTARFPIYQTWTPKPTPTQYINYFGNGSIKPDVVTVTIVQIQTQIVDKWHTATPTPPITDALGDKIEYPYVPGEKIPEGAGIVALLCIVGIVMVRDWKWKK